MLLGERTLMNAKEIRIRLMRAVKDKLQGGFYVMLVTLYDRLGGAPLVWTRVGSSQFVSPGLAATQPFKHKGRYAGIAKQNTYVLIERTRYYDRELWIDQSVFVLGPPQARLQPSNCFIFELFELAGSRSPVDRVCGWAALPASNDNFQYVEGRFRAPMLRGSTVKGIDQYLGIDRIISEDIQVKERKPETMRGLIGVVIRQSWLCNLYVELRVLPCAMRSNGEVVQEYDLELDFINTQVFLGPSNR
jgi:hypothetical protein